MGCDVCSRLFFKYLNLKHLVRSLVEYLSGTQAAELAYQRLGTKLAVPIFFRSQLVGEHRHAYRTYPKDRAQKVGRRRNQSREH